MPYEYGMNYFGGQESPPSTGTDEDELYKYFMSLSGPKKIPGIESAVPPQPMPTEPKKIPSEDPLYDEFMALPHPPPPLPPEPTRWEKARAMAEQAGVSGRAPIPTGPGIIQGARPDLGQIAGNLWSGVKSFGPEMLKLAGQITVPIANPGAPLMEQGMAQSAQEKAKTMGISPPPTPPVGVNAMKQGAIGLAEFFPKTIAEFIANPVEKFNKDPFSVLVLATGGSGKAIKKWIGNKVTVDALTPADLQSAFKETMAHGPKPSAPPELVKAFESLETPPVTEPIVPTTGEPLITTPGGTSAVPPPSEFSIGSIYGGHRYPISLNDVIVKLKQHGYDVEDAISYLRSGKTTNRVDINEDLAIFPLEVAPAGEPVVPPAEVPVPQGQIPEKVSVPSGEMPTPETMGKILGIPDLFMKMPIDELTELVDTGNEGARAALRVRVGAKTRMPGPGEIRGLGVEFVNERGEPISRAEAYRVKKNVSVTEKPTTVPTALQIDPIIQRTINSIKEATPVIGEQETLYSAERSKRLGAAMAAGKEIPGMAGYVAQRGALKGPLEKVAFELKNKIPPEDIDYIMQKIQDSPAVKGYDSISAKTAFFKLTEGVLPQDQELAHLTTAIGPELVKVIRDKRTTFEKIRDVGLDALGVSKAIMSSTDLSFGFRQGLAIAARHPIIFAKAWPKQFGWFLHENAYKASNELILNDPLYKLAKKAKLSLTDLGKKMATREEPFMSPMAEKIPIVGSVVRASNRAYTGMSNKLRMDTFKYLVNRAEKLGLKPSKNLDLTSNIAKVVNTGTGRGGLGAFERAAVPLNQIFFSPRLWASRLQMLNPVYYMKLDPFARKEALTTLFSLVGAGTTVLGLAKAAGAKVGMDPRSADFGKIIIGNTRIDIWGGFQQNVRLAAQLITGKLVSSTTGKITTLGEGYRPLNRMDILERTVGYKASPIFSFAMNLMKGTGTMGNKLNIGSEVATRFVPMVIQDAYDIYKDDPSLLPLSALGVFGVGLQTYKIKRGSRGW